LQACRLMLRDTSGTAGLIAQWLRTAVPRLIAPAQGSWRHCARRVERTQMQAPAVLAMEQAGGFILSLPGPCAARLYRNMHGIGACSCECSLNHSVANGLAPSCQLGVVSHQLACQALKGVAAISAGNLRWPAALSILGMALPWHCLYMVLRQCLYTCGPFVSDTDSPRC
jgi:hypothetical protein